jgi:nucleoside-diphosphate-sugar epimerase
MLFANGTTGTLGRHLLNSVVPITTRIENYTTSNLPQFSAPDQVIHLAGVVGANQVDLDSKYARQTNVDKLSDFAAICIKSRISRFVYVSSSHVYGPSLVDLGENHETNPQSEYARQKLEAEERLIEIFSQKKVSSKLLILRVFSVLDISTKPTTLGGAIGSIISGVRIEPIQNTNDVRDFLTPKIIANGILKVCTYPNIEGIYNLCSQKSISVYSAAESIFRHHNFENYQRFLHEGVSNSPRIVGSNQKLKNLIPDLDLQWPYKTES